ncbi:MAG: GGDEF domain-containing protein [Thermoleophilaceae bacterium]|nr:GGDEF domain-containing protein [Thermoleophilaceae bacterium]
MADGGGNPLSERFLKTTAGVALFMATTGIIFAVSFLPVVAPSQVNFWRIALAAPAILITIALVLLGPRLSSRAFQAGIELMVVPILGVNLILLLISPATIAVLFNMLATMIYAGYFLRRSALGMTLALGIGISLSTLFFEPAASTPHIGAFLVVYIPTFVLMALLLHLQNTETLSALNLARRRAMEDPLTGLGNLRALEREARKRLTVKSRSRTSGVTGLLLIDLDNFKSANSMHGHIGGDHALRMVAHQLMRVAPKDAVVARVGGDEFAVLTSAGSRAGVEEKGEIFRGAVRAASSIMEMDGVAIDAAVGCAVYPDDGRDLSELLDGADRAMYAAKGAKHHELPDRATVAPDPTVRPAWLDAELVPATAEPTGHSILESMTGGNSARFGSISLYARTSAIAWAFGSVVLGISLLMPDAPASLLPWWLVLFGGLILSAGILKVNARPRSSLHGLFDCAALAGLAGLIALTGGLESTVPPLLILLAASQAWFWSTDGVVPRILGPVAVALSPLLYDTVGSGDQAWLTGVMLFSECCLIIAIVGAMYYNRILLSKLQNRAEELATTDPLTGISNRRAFSAFVEDLLDDEEHQQFAIVMLDLDNFKQVNTARGHRAGDSVLVAIAAALNTVARADDCVARVGGDEFAAVLPGVGVDGARALAERLVQTVADTPEARDAGVGASAGFALHPLHGETVDQLTFTADSALMAVKASGKGSARVARVVSAV